jgi:lipoprotein-releasing system permease protein/zinc transport system substrate-binding protein
VLVRYRDKQLPAVLKGVSNDFEQLVPIENILVDGEWKLQDEINPYAVLGIGVASVLGIQAGYVFPLEMYAPKRRAEVNLANPMTSFNTDYAYIGGIFRVNQPVYDDSYLLVSLDFARNILDYTTEVSAWELKLHNPAQVQTVQKKIQQLLGADYRVKDRYEQQEASFKMINFENWMTFLMLCFILLIAVFNVIGSLSMLIVDKQADIATLRNLGADNRVISRIFLLEGWLISALGGVLGIVFGVLLCLGQQTFGWISLGASGSFAVDAYPVVVEPSDLLIILAAVLLIGYLAVRYPVQYLSKKLLQAR